MKKNVMMRVAAMLLVCVLASTCGISGTFAKYVTSTSSQDAARVAKWGFEPADLMLDNLFLSSYTNVVSNNGEDVIAKVKSIPIIVLSAKINSEDKINCWCHGY